MAQQRLPRAVTVLLITACLTVTVAGVRSASGIIGPATLALVLTITVHPLKSRLERTALPGWASSLVAVVAVYVLLLSLTAALGYAVAQLANLLPAYTPKMQDYLTQIGSWLETMGVGSDQVHKVLSSLDVNKVVSIASNILGAAVGIMSNLLFVVTLALFMAFDSTSMRNCLAAVGKSRPDLVAALDKFAVGTRNYMGVSTVFGFIVAVIDWVALALMGVPGAFVWAVLSFVTNFIPNIGFAIGVIPPAIIALLEGGPGLMIAVIVVYSLINVIIQSVIQPRYVGDKVGLSGTITMLSLVFWAWVLGAMGALLAVPLTLLVRALLIDADPESRWALPLISGKVEVAPEDA